MRMAGVAQAYRGVDSAARVAMADRHGLVQLMFDELVAALGRAQAACERRERAARSHAAGQALSILAGLSSALDAERGGEVAALLASVYAQSSAEIIAAGQSERPEAYAAVAARIADIGDAWRLIGDKP